jgi:NAD+ synthase
LSQDEQFNDRWPGSDCASAREVSVLNISDREFTRDCLRIDCRSTSQQIESAMRDILSHRLHRQGVVVAVSGGVDSAVCAVLAARALGPQRVLGLLLPEADSSADTTAKGRLVCEFTGIRYEIQDIAPALEALGCYRCRDQAVRSLFPDYGPGWRMKIAVAENLLATDRLNYFTLIVESPDGRQARQRMPVEVYRQVVAATNMKQRTRKLLEYYHAERLSYAVLGTPNRLEYDLGFFVRGGDGLADLKPIAHLYKTQVYSLAAFLGIPEEIRNQPPSTDTYSMPQTQEEFFFALPYDQMDLLLYAYLNGLPADQTGAVMGLTPQQVERVYRDIVGKRRMAEYLNRAPVLLTDSNATDGSSHPVSQISQISHG